MPIYAFRCRACGNTEDQTFNTPYPCRCGDLMKREFIVHTPIPRRQFIPHYNHSVGAFVESNKHFDELLKRGSEQQSIATGIDHNYVRVEAPDVAHTVSGEALYEERKALSDHRQGLPPKPPELAMES